MLSCHYTKDLLNLQGVNIIKIEQFEFDTFIYTQLPIKPHICPCCSEETSYIHDYRKRKIKDISAFGKNITLILKQEMYYGTTYYSFDELKEAIEKYIKYYNEKRIKEKLGVQYNIDSTPWLHKNSVAVIKLLRYKKSNFLGSHHYPASIF